MKRYSPNSPSQLHTFPYTRYPGRTHTSKCTCTPPALHLGKAAKRAPRDPDLRAKLAECEKAVKRIRFEEALATPVGGGEAGQRC